jgi:hypothetical protein
MEFHWHNLAKIYWETYVKSMAMAGVEVHEKFEELSEAERNAMMDALEHTGKVYATAALA